MKHTTKRATIRFSALTSLAMTMAVACGGGSDMPPGGTNGIPTDGTETTWNPSGETGQCNVDALLAARSYGAKIKTLLTAMPLEEAELAQLESDPDALGELIDGWLATAEAEILLRQFFMNAFQQTGGDVESFFYMLGRAATNSGFFQNPRSPNVHEMLNANFSESFARTAVELVKQGRPFHEALTTDTFMMTTAQMMYLAYVDDDVVDDDQKHTVRTTNGHFPTMVLYRDEAAAPPPSQSLDPNHANFGRFWHSRLSELASGCNVQATQTLYQNPADGQWRIANATMSPSYFVFGQLIGRHESVRRHPNTCATGARVTTPLLDRGDFSDWRMVKVEKAKAGDEPTIFYDLKQLRTSASMTLHTDRIGFFSTPGFMGTWQNNEDNSSRVTINQILIVALGASFDGVAVTDFSPANLDGEHSSSSECYGCHQTLDPMRDFVRASYTNFYGQQLDPDRASLPGDFVFGGVKQSGNGIRDLAAVLANHPQFGRGWAQKLCFYANAEACPEGPELDRVVEAFVDSGHDFRVLIRELFASPLVSGKACVDGVDAGTTASIARRSHFCAQLSHRLGVEDLCGTFTHSRDASPLQNQVRSAIASVPDDSFSRAVVEPVVIGETSLFTRANREAACALAAQNGFNQLFEGVLPEDALEVMVTMVMGLPTNDERHEPALSILESHVDEAMEAGATEAVALQSAFVLACMSPSSAGVGF